MYSVLEMGVANALTAGVLAAVVWVTARLIQRPALTHALWVVVLLKLVTPPIVEVPIGMRLDRIAAFAQQDQTLASPPPAVRLTPIRTWTAGLSDANDDLRRADRTAPDTPAVDRHGGVQPAAALRLDPLKPSPRAARGPRRSVSWLLFAALAVWGIGSLLWFAVQSFRILLFWPFLRSAKLAPAHVQRQTAELARRIGARRAPRVWLVPATISPMLWAVGSNAKLLFPEGLLDRVHADSRATLLVHELAHFRRRDHWVRVVELIVTGIFWWHPVVWLARRHIEIAEEQCCDAWVVGQFPAQPRCYAEALLETIDFLCEQPPHTAPAASGLGDVPFLRTRLRMIMCGVPPKSMSGATRLAVLMAATLFLPLGPELFGAALNSAGAAFASVTAHDVVANEAAASIPAEPPVLANLAQTKTAVIVDVGEPFPKVVAAPEPAEVPPVERDVQTWAVAVSPNQQFCVTAQTDGGLILSDLTSSGKFDLTRYRITSVAFTPDNRHLAAGGLDSMVHLIDCLSGERLASLSGMSAAVRSVSFSPDGRLLVASGRDGLIKVWDAVTLAEAARVPTQSAAVHCVRFAPNGQVLAMASGDWLTGDGGRVVLWDLQAMRVCGQFDDVAPVGALAFSGDKTLHAADWNGRVSTWTLESGRMIRTCQVHKDVVSIAAFAAGNGHALIEAINAATQPVSIETAWSSTPDQGIVGDHLLAWDKALPPLLRTTGMADAESANFSNDSDDEPSQGNLKRD